MVNGSRTWRDRSWLCRTGPLEHGGVCSPSCSGSASPNVLHVKTFSCTLYLASGMMQTELNVQQTSRRRAQSQSKELQRIWLKRAAQIETSFVKSGIKHLLGPFTSGRSEECAPQDVKVWFDGKLLRDRVQCTAPCESFKPHQTQTCCSKMKTRTRTTAYCCCCTTPHSVKHCLRRCSSWRQTCSVLFKALLGVCVCDWTLSQCSSRFRSPRLVCRRT